MRRNLSPGPAGHGGLPNPCRLPLSAAAPRMIGGRHRERREPIPRPSPALRFLWPQPPVAPRRRPRTAWSQVGGWAVALFLVSRSQVSDPQRHSDGAFVPELADMNQAGLPKPATRADSAGCCRPLDRTEVRPTQEVGDIMTDRDYPRIQAHQPLTSPPPPKPY